MNFSQDYETIDGFLVFSVKIQTETGNQTRIDRQTQACKQTGRQTDIRLYTQRHTDTQIKGQADKQIDETTK